MQSPQTNMRVIRGKLKIGLGPCHECDGLGTIHPTEVKRCSRCFGKGEISYYNWRTGGPYSLHTLYGSRENRKHTKQLIREHRTTFVTASCISRMDGTLCDHIGVFVTRDVVLTTPVFADTPLPDFVELRRSA